MDSVAIQDGPEHLAELLERAAGGENERIADACISTVRLAPVLPIALTAQRVTDTLPPFVPLARLRALGRLKVKCTCRHA